MTRSVEKARKMIREPEQLELPLCEVDHDLDSAVEEEPRGIETIDILGDDDAT